MNKRGGHRPRNDDPLVAISKNLSWLLRHGAIEEGLNIDKDGFVRLSEILAKDFYKSKRITEKEIREVVENNDKKRFEIKTISDENGNPVLYIRASQGHSIKAVEDEGLLKKATNPSELPICLHGTNKDAWEPIRKEGLKSMTRNHMHFAGGFPGENGVISGMRQSCTVFIEVDVAKAMNDGIEFFISENNVILSRGINGVMPPKYFKKVTIRDKGGLKEVDPKLYRPVAAPNEEVKEDPQSDENIAKAKANAQEESKVPEKKSASGQHFKYLCVLDFEAQCKNNERLDVQEIIEFPVVIVDVEKKTILDDKFHQYIKPVVHPKLYDFCVELTGITQDKVNSGILLAEALDKLDTFLKEKGVLDSTFCFVTCGDWDLNSCLKRETTSKHIPVRSYLKSYINLKKAYPVPFGSTVKNPDMVEMLKLSKLDLIGKHHSGIDDANNIARVVTYLLDKNFKFSPSLVAKSNY